jgi:hypothetical protein
MQLKVVQKKLEAKLHYGDFCVRICLQLCTGAGGGGGVIKKKKKKREGKNIQLSLESRVRVGDFNCCTLLCKI